MALPLNQSDLTQKSHQVALACTHVLYFSLPEPHRTTVSNRIPSFLILLLLNNKGLLFQNRNLRGLVRRLQVTLHLLLDQANISMFDISMQLTFSLFFLLSETEMYKEITIDLHRSAQIQQKLLFGFVFITILNFDFALYPDCTTTCILMLPNSVQTPVRSSQVAGCFSVLCQGQVHNRAVETLFCKHQSKLNDLQKPLTTCWGFSPFCFKAHIDLLGQLLHFIPSLVSLSTHQHWNLFLHIILIVLHHGRRFQVYSLTSL